MNRQWIYIALLALALVASLGWTMKQNSKISGLEEEVTKARMQEKSLDVANEFVRLLMDAKGNEEKIKKLTTSQAQNLIQGSESDSDEHGEEYEGEEGALPKGVKENFVIDATYLKKKAEDSPRYQVLVRYKVSYQVDKKVMGNDYEMVVDIIRNGDQLKVDHYKLEAVTPLSNGGGGK
ncbi:hypothetical protein SAMN04487866_12242 [Thermoactinomyces sp. DSM 45891]|uniref:hypothetical protein n=1 Tax=Thermoactinomyces sp. DSM 45891 TaxID=1761907 RepID=UPI00091AD022|nr:hypothetical protein [Thermoactinomyces sp. DSM 45891]SFX75277.1 hypothetical protein SAMN04487866_12242 [Thermoactinomyces sp. DSM 45891]